MGRIAAGSQGGNVKNHPSRRLYKETTATLVLGSLHFGGISRITQHGAAGEEGVVATIGVDRTPRLGHSIPKGGKNRPAPRLGHGRGTGNLMPPHDTRSDRRN